jgi:hypothetical protein
MANIHDAIYALNPTIKSISGMDAFNANGASVQYDLAAAQAKLVELQAAEAQAEKDAKDAKASAIAKLTALGLTQAEINALIGA